MSGARRMQELKYFRDGAALVISLDGLSWLCQRKCSDKRIQKRDEELQLLMSSGQMIQAEEEPQPITCLCILHRRGSVALQLWRNSDRRSSLATWLPTLTVSPRHSCLLEEAARRSTFTSSASFVSVCPKEAQWTRLSFSMQDIFSLIKKDLHIVTRQRAVTMDSHRFVIFSDEDLPLQCFGDICQSEDCRTSIGDTDWHISDDNVFSDLKNSTASWTCGANTKTHNSKRVQHKLAVRDNLNTCVLKPCQICNGPGVLSGRDETLKKRKSVSFDDDVTVFLFDQERPTVELHSGPCTSLPRSYSCNQPDVTLEDSGLEWEDDFSALEKSCQFQCVRHSAPAHHTLSPPSQSLAALPGPERAVLSQTWLFLTHVTQSDLEL